MSKAPDFRWRFNPAPDSTGFDLFEHWEVTSAGEPYLLAITSAPEDRQLHPGDLIIRRCWAPAGEPEIYNHARNTKDNE